MNASQVYISNEKAVKCYDMLRSPSLPVLELKSNKTSGETLECVEVGLNGNVVCAGTDAGIDSRILFFDIRNPSKVLGEINDVHSDAVTRLKFQHSDNTKLLSGSMDGLMCDLDIATINASSLVSVFNAHSPIDRYFFFFLVVFINFC